MEVLASAIGPGSRDSPRTCGSVRSPDRRDRVLSAESGVVVVSAAVSLQQAKMKNSEELADADCRRSVARNGRLCPRRLTSVGKEGFGKEREGEEECSRSQADSLH